MVIFEESGVWQWYWLIEFVCSVVAPSAASDKELRMFHSAEYLECLQRLSQLDDSEKSVDNMEEFGLGKRLFGLVEGDCKTILRVKS